jgi:hypothetical protein
MTEAFVRCVAAGSSPMKMLPALFLGGENMGVVNAVRYEEIMRNGEAVLDLNILESKVREENHTC